MIGFDEAEGELRDIYLHMRQYASERPAIYTPPGGEVANIIRCHSLDPEGLRLAFGISSPIHWGPRSLPWIEREMINTVTSQTNGCFY